MSKTVQFITGPGRIKVSADEHVKNMRVVQLTTLKIYHQRKIQEIDSELEMLLKENVDNVDY